MEKMKVVPEGISNSIILETVKEEEEYLLTAEDEQNIIDYAIKKAKHLFQWQRLEKGQNLKDIELKILQIDWNTMIDKEALFATANKARYRLKWEEFCREKERKEQEEKEKQLRSEWTSQRFYHEISYISRNVFDKPLRYNDDTAALIKTWCYFLGNDSRFETELNYKFNRGLLLRGISGLGKTYIAECLQYNGYKPVSIYSMLEISKIVKGEGEFIPRVKSVLYLDDVGSETAVVNHWGTKINWFKEFMELYYLKHNDYSGLVISTNNSMDQLEKSYGFRFRSRIKDMFNIVDVKGTDMRGT